MSQLKRAMRDASCYKGRIISIMSEFGLLLFYNHYFQSLWSMQFWCRLKDEEENIFCDHIFFSAKKHEKTNISKQRWKLLEKRNYTTTFFQEDDPPLLEEDDFDELVSWPLYYTTTQEDDFDELGQLDLVQLVINLTDQNAKAQ